MGLLNHCHLSKITFFKVKIFSFYLLVFFLCLFFQNSYAVDQTIPFLVSKQTSGTVAYSLSVKILAVMTLLTVLPALLITMTAFTRVIIVLAIARQAIGVPNVPGNQIMIGLALMMTLYVMMPIFQKINDQAIQPYLDGKINEQQTLEGSIDYLKTFMMKQTRKIDLSLFQNLAKRYQTRYEANPRKTENNVSKNSPHSFIPALSFANGLPSIFILMPAFITSELKTAFQIGFLILMPFLIIDIVISGILMSMGMMMLSPMVISLPFKILFFVMADGWSLLVVSVIKSFR